MSKPDLRDALIAELQGQLADMADQFEEYRTNSERLLAVETENARLTGKNEVLATVVPIGERLGALADGMEALEAKVRKLPRTQQGGVEDALTLLQDQMTSLSQAVQISLDGGPVRPLLSEVLEDWTEVRSGFGIDPKKVNTDRNRILDFMAFAGDKLEAPPLAGFTRMEFSASFSKWRSLRPSRTSSTFIEFESDVVSAANTAS